MGRELQVEKLATLGKMAAGLAHELNNPAAAAQRSAAQLVETLKKFAKVALRNDARFTAAERERVVGLLIEVVKGRQEVCVLGTLERSDRETALADWLEGHGLAEPWSLTPIFLDAGMTSDRLQQFGDGWVPDTLAQALQWMDSCFSLTELALDVEQSVRRISEVAKAMKEYVHLDPSALATVDVNRCLDVTLLLFGHRLKGGVQVERNYDMSLPALCSHPGELNQVWTNLIDNALDAMEGHGTLRIRTQHEPGFILVEIGDSGPGIPPDVQGRIFEPFFTTKPVGQGTGLGLDICYRIVTHRHHGTITVASVPGDTRFLIRLPEVPPTDRGDCPTD